jgi:prepilin-type N-terminal cleavage/methylation domain-containing protein
MIRKSAHRFARRGFTLIEVMVVVGIILILLAILVPGIGAFRVHAAKVTTTSNLNIIRSGITQYYGDFNMYPPSSPLVPGTATLAFPVVAPSPGILAGHGDQMLAEALMGYLPGSADGAGTDFGDGEFGFRTKKVVNALMGRGEIKGPYASPDAKMYDGTNHCFVDGFNPPPPPQSEVHGILYYCSTRATPDPTLPHVTNIFGTGAANTYYFNSADCSAVSIKTTSTTSTADPSAAKPGFFASIGATSNTVFADVVGANSFLLISAGPDGVYFTKDDIVLSK